MPDNMKKLWEQLGLESLDEEKQEEIKNHINELIDSKADEKASDLADGKLEEKEQELKEFKENLTEEYEDKFEQYKNEVVSQFSNFIDEVLEEELQIPEKVLEYAHIGEQYHDLIEQFKMKLAIDEGVLDSYTKDLLKEAQGEIEKLRKDYDKATKKAKETEGDAKELAASLYLRKKCDGLDENVRNRVLKILEGETDVDEIERKFKTIVETAKIKENKKEDDDDDPSLNENDDDKGHAHQELDESSKSGEKENKGSSESPFEKAKQHYVDVLKTGKL